MHISKEGAVIAVARLTCIPLTLSILSGAVAIPRQFVGSRSSLMCGIAVLSENCREVRNVIGSRHKYSPHILRRMNAAVRGALWVIGNRKSHVHSTDTTS